MIENSENILEKNCGAYDSVLDSSSQVELIYVKTYCQSKFCIVVSTAKLCFVALKCYMARPRAQQRPLS